MPYKKKPGDVWVKVPVPEENIRDLKILLKAAGSNCRIFFNAVIQKELDKKRVLPVR
jgi:hypothetical protein